MDGHVKMSFTGYNATLESSAGRFAISVVPERLNDLLPCEDCVVHLAVLRLIGTSYPQRGSPDTTVAWF